MNFIDIILAIYPLYLSVLAIKNSNISEIQGPHINKLKHCVIFWVLWFELSFVSTIINLFFWWVPFTSVFETLKLILILMAYKPGFANALKIFFVEFVWEKSRENIPTQFLEKFKMLCQRYPNLDKYYKMTVIFMNDFIGITKNLQTKHFNDTHKKYKYENNNKNTKSVELNIVN